MKLEDIAVGDELTQQNIKELDLKYKETISHIIIYQKDRVRLFLVKKENDKYLVGLKYFLPIVNGI